MIGREETVVEDCYQVLNWLEVVSILAVLARNGWNWLKLVNVVGLV
jgi:hypothetical protein